MKKLVLIGHPIGHSLSPAMHNAALKKTKLDKNVVYEKKDIMPDKLDNFIEQIKQRKIFGANVTIPYKIEIMKRVDKLTKEAELIGAVNTIYMKEGKIIGHNTDGIGFIESLNDKGIVLRGKQVVLLGSGGAARAVAFSLAQNKVEKITIVCLDKNDANKFASELKQKTNVKTDSKGFKDLKKILKNANLLVNCTPVGMKGLLENNSPVEKKALHKNLIVVDVVYNPLKTILLKDAEEMGCKTVSGIGMLVHQGAAGFEIWTGKCAPVTIMKNVLIKKLRKNNITKSKIKNKKIKNIEPKNNKNRYNKKTNIALIGFMGTGKTTIAKIIAKKIKMRNINVDYEIEKNAKKKISEIFEKYDEERFRAFETDAIKKAAAQSNCVIDCGGGVVLKDINITSLRESSIIVLLKADKKKILERVSKNKKRPLLNTENIIEKRKKITALLKSREPLYKKTAELTIDTTHISPEEAADRIIKLIR